MERGPQTENLSIPSVLLTTILGPVYPDRQRDHCDYASSTTLVEDNGVTPKSNQCQDNLDSLVLALIIHSLIQR